MAGNTLADILPGMQQNQLQAIEAVLKPRGRIAESPKNRAPGERLGEFYSMNPHMRSGEFDPSGAIANSRRNFQTWQQDQLARAQGYNALREENRRTDKLRPQVPTATGLAGLVGSQGEGANSNASPVAVQGPPAPSGTPRINRTTGLPFGYNPGDDLSGMPAGVQAAGQRSVDTTNRTTQDEIARRNHQSQTYNQGLQGDVNPQMRMGPDGQYYPVAQPVQGADARIGYDQFQQDQDYLRNQGGTSQGDLEASARMMEYQRQNGIGGVSPSAAGNVNVPTPSVPQPRQMIDPSQYMVQGGTPQPAPGPMQTPEMAPQVSSLVQMITDLLEEQQGQYDMRQDFPQPQKPFVGPPAPNPQAQNNPQTQNNPQNQTSNNKRFLTPMEELDQLGQMMSFIPEGWNTLRDLIDKGDRQIFKGANSLGSLLQNNRY